MKEYRWAPFGIDSGLAEVRLSARERATLQAAVVIIDNLRAGWGSYPDEERLRFADLDLDADLCLGAHAMRDLATDGKADLV
jgi:hypothetical protein